MVRTRNGFAQTGTQAAQMQMQMDPQALLAAMQSGQDINQVMAEMQAKNLRENATGGILTVRLVRNMPIKKSPTTGRWYALGTLVSAVGVKVQGGRTLTEKHLQKLGQLEVDLGVSESLKDQIEDYRNENGGSHHLELVVDGESQITNLQVRYPKGHEQQGQNVFLIDSEGDSTSPRNWTSEDTGNPLMKYQLRVHCIAMLGATQASIPGIDLPQNDDEFDSFLEKAGKLNSVLSARGLDQWRKQRSTAATAMEQIAQNLVEIND